MFAQVFDGMDVVRSIMAVETDSNDKPLEDVTILSAEIVPYELNFLNKFSIMPNHFKEEVSMAIVHPTAENFDALIRDNKLVLVDFFATWCGPCKMIAPFIEEVAEEYEGKAVVAKIDVDEAQEIAAEYGISSIPTVILFKDGRTHPH